MGVSMLCLSRLTLWDTSALSSADWTRWRSNWFSGAAATFSATEKARGLIPEHKPRTAAGRPQGQSA